MISKTYNPREIEDKWYSYWIENRYFNSKPNPDKEPYTIVIPPPNVTGVLHMGHMLNNTIQDVLVRKARMEGKEACWVPGTDHASIATEAKVVAMLKEQGIQKSDLTREEFYKYAWEWTDKYGGIILKQLRKLGASCDWDRTRFTMEPSLYDAVIDTFIDLYNKGYIYRGHRMVNWDPQAKTTVSDEEVITKEVMTKLCYLRYPIVGENEDIIIATVRPETIMADSAICVHPDDERFKHLHGKKALIPLINREIPIITDEYVTMDFGTGALKVTPAHDQNDYDLGVKHKLEIIDILTEEGKLNEKALILVGEDRFVARKKIIKLLEESGNLEKIEDYKSNVGHSERTNAVIEPRLSLQWFVRMKELCQPALENVMNDNIQLHPPKFKNTYRIWIENIRDWNISRQLWWGQQIPAYYLSDGTVIVAKNKREALRKAQHEMQLFALTEADLTQDPDVVDTWFSSWLWPISVFDGIKDTNNEDINYYYPTNDLVTAPEILFFWVMRMIIAGYEFRGELPFRNVYLTGIVRDPKGRKMSKSLGNSPEPLALIEQYGADGVRTGMLFSSPAGNDLLFDEKLCEQGRNFCNKIWNAFRLVKGWEVYSPQSPVFSAQLAVNWFESKLNQTVTEVLDLFSKYRISDALNAVYKLIWDDFCSQYLEMIKPEYGQPIDKDTFEATIDFFERIMALTHPFMPFITEEIWQDIRPRGEKESLCVAEYPTIGAIDTALLANVEIFFEIVTNIRNLRSTKNISPKTALPLTIKTENQGLYQPFEGLLVKLANISEINYATDQADGMSFLVKADEFFVNLAGELDVAAEIENLQKELEYSLGFKKSVEAKLSNERFVQNAKADVVEKERQKLADAEAKIVAIQESLTRLKA
ncbi:valine--tRNA ligase [Runella sp. CRIBMP]|uniref:valine--tRNA ligase n=1 Tax=Runella sp. CRIBMP TaxID=2683261 RepID=UPI0014131996|nr:valine--tRNA ligase [Runella sp. CRIBMP]NBB21132.1 valine--tRNA ligase [Runella sp. CRIBMP]